MVRTFAVCFRLCHNGYKNNHHQAKGENDMKKLIVFVLLICMLLPSVAHAEWSVEQEEAETGMSFSPDAPSAPATNPAPGGGYFLGDGPTIILPDELPVTVTPAPVPTPKATPKPTAKPTPASTPKLEIQGDYEKGSVYGSRLTPKELAKVKSAVETALKACIHEDMSEAGKLTALVDYLCDASVYAESYKGNANNAYGALVDGKAQCSGYARAFKALCDGAGIDCYYVYAASDDPINPNHQWCMVEYGGQWYHIDPQMIDDYTRIVNGKLTYPRPIVLMANHLTYNDKGLPQTAEKSIILR